MSRMNGRLFAIHVEEPGPAAHLPLTTVNAACSRFFQRRGLYEPSWKEAVGLHVQRAVKARGRRRRNPQAIGAA